MGGFSSLGHGLGAGLNSVFGVSASQSQQYNYNKELQQMAQDWQEKMSNTAYQRSVNDLTQAGMNPLLSYNSGGATTGSSGSPGVGAGTGSGGQVLASLVSSFMSSIGNGSFARNSASAKQATASSERQEIENKAFKAYVDNILELPVWAQQIALDRMYSRDQSGVGNAFRMVSAMLSHANNSGKSWQDLVPEKKPPSVYEQKSRPSGWSLVRSAGKSLLNRRKK